MNPSTDDLMVFLLSRHSSSTLLALQCAELVHGYGNEKPCIPCRRIVQGSWITLAIVWHRAVRILLLSRSIATSAEAIHPRKPLIKREAGRGRNHLISWKTRITSASISRHCFRINSWAIEYRRIGWRRGECIRNEPASPERTSSYAEVQLRALVKTIVGFVIASQWITSFPLIQSSRLSEFPGKPRYIQWQYHYLPSLRLVGLMEFTSFAYPHMVAVRDACKCTYSFRVWIVGPFLRWSEHRGNETETWS